MKSYYFYTTFSNPQFLKKVINFRNNIFELHHLSKKEKKNWYCIHFDKVIWRERDEKKGNFAKVKLHF